MLPSESVKLSKDIRAAFAKMGKRGGQARAKALTRERRSELSSLAAKARWANYRKEKASV